VLLRETNGRAIDQAEAVFRFNDGPTAGCVRAAPALPRPNPNPNPNPNVSALGSAPLTPQWVRVRVRGTVGVRVRVRARSPFFHESVSVPD